MDKQRVEALSELQEEISYRFQDLYLLNVALTHRSYANERADGTWMDNKRLEFLGDSVLNVIISHLIMEHHPHCQEGMLTKLRAGLVNQQFLTEISKSLGISRYVLLGKGEFLRGGGKRSSLIADAYEALIGAIYLDGGFEAAFQVVEKQFIPFIEAGLPEDGDFKTKVQQICQGRFGCTPRYQLSDLKGPEHEKTFRAEIFVGGELYGYGIGRNKKEAQQHAAREALAKICGDNRDQQ